jgi:hypothetical protein
MYLIDTEMGSVIKKNTEPDLCVRPRQPARKEGGSQTGTWNTLKENLKFLDLSAISGIFLIKHRFLNIFTCRFLPIKFFI